MKKKTGFTLIELLAVIIILVVIALITIPIALNVINNVRKNAFKSTAYGLIDAIKLQAAENFFNDQLEDLSILSQKQKDSNIVGKHQKEEH